MRSFVPAAIVALGLALAGGAPASAGQANQPPAVMRPPVAVLRSTSPTLPHPQPEDATAPISNGGVVNGAEGPKARHDELI